MKKILLLLILTVCLTSCNITKKTQSQQIIKSEWLPKSFDEVEKWFDEQHTEIYSRHKS